MEKTKTMKLISLTTFFVVTIMLLHSFIPHDSSFKHQLKLKTCNNQKSESHSFNEIISVRQLCAENEKLPNNPFVHTHEKIEFDIKPIVFIKTRLNKNNKPLTYYKNKNTPTRGAPFMM